LRRLTNKHTRKKGKKRKDKSQHLSPIKRASSRRRSGDPALRPEKNPKLPGRSPKSSRARERKNYLKAREKN